MQKLLSYVDWYKIVVQFEAFSLIKTLLEIARFQILYVQSAYNSYNMVYFT